MSAVTEFFVGIVQSRLLRVLLILFFQNIFLSVTSLSANLLYSLSHDPKWIEEPQEKKKKKKKTRV